MNEWVSVECELPETDDTYFVTWKNNKCGPFIGICEFHNGKWLINNMYQSKWYHNIKIIAWMDAKPYKED